MDSQTVAAVAQIVAAVVMAYYSYETYRLRKVADAQLAQSRVQAEGLESQLAVAKRASRLSLKPTFMITFKTRARLEALINRGDSTEDEKESAVRVLARKGISGRSEVTNLSSRIALAVGLVWFDARQRQFCLTESVWSNIGADGAATIDFTDKFVLREEANKVLCYRYSLNENEIVSELLDPPADGATSFILAVYEDIDSNVYAQRRTFQVNEKNISKYVQGRAWYLGQTGESR